MFEALQTPFSWLSPTLIVLLGVACLASVDLVARARHQRSHYAFGALLGTVLAAGGIKFLGVLFSDGNMANGVLMAFGVLLLIIGWKLLFGPWAAHVKATVLGTFLFWILFTMLVRETPQERLAHLIAITLAVVPAVVWCVLFLPYHRERLSRVLLMFFSGMASTVPVLFYDALVRRGIELQFFVVRIVPESFSTNVREFFQTLSLSPLQATLASLFVSFLFVGLLEEGSKGWVLNRNGRRYFRSIDDAIQMAILVAIGFAFAENITSTGYFFTFVKQYLLIPGGPDWGSFLGNIVGRSILTSMVHIVSTGVLGYFLARAIFAEPTLRDGDVRGKSYAIAELVHRVLQVQRTTVFSVQMLLIGGLLSTTLHALSNFLVTLPDVLPGHPNTLGDLLGSPDGSPFHYVALLIIPSLLYVVGGFWLLTMLFGREENSREQTGQFVPGAIVSPQ